MDEDCFPVIQKYQTHQFALLYNGIKIGYEYLDVLVAVPDDGPHLLSYCDLLLILSHPIVIPDPLHTLVDNIIVVFEILHLSLQPVGYLID